MAGKSIEELKIGDSAEFTKTLTESDICLYAGITGDFNPAHIDETYAGKTRFKGRVAHGMLVAGLVSAVLGTRLPGPGTIYLKQDLKFHLPVRIGDTITARVEITSIVPRRNLAYLRTTCSNQDGKLVLDGEAVVMPPTATAE
ncbi:MAG: MaoC family dehydratase [Desulfobacteraceae bacterium]|nr:MaoC family dehydratase [Desulfobacteraceae bacterium]